ncbi:biotin transporter BioY [Bacillus piscicola]|uniref:biotin transporter BioY n=1 Tax=Bacillus piscicola TaxID=1632684 RepID=UPI001F08DEAD|nr:biotin transporter BioY [Bacillus piscicola]
MALGALFVALTAVGANITAFVPFMVVGGVPITLQTFFAVLAGLVLGSRLGAFSMFVYMMIGLAGAPVFAQFKGGLAALVSPTFGFILSFILVAYVAGKMIENKSAVRAFVVAALTAMAINYVFGTNWMYAAYVFWFDAPEGFTYKLAWLWMMAPLPKDIILTVLSGIFAFRLHNIPVIKRIVARQNKAA